MKRKSDEISTPFYDTTNNNEDINTETILRTTEEEYYIILFGIDYKNNKDYINLINKII